MLNEQDKRVVETMARCGLDIDALQAMFPSATKEEIEAIQREVNDNKDDYEEENNISINCSWSAIKKCTKNIMK